MELKEGNAQVIRDPVCKMEVKGDSKITSNYKGKEYRFCSEDCKKAFKLAPEKYVKD
jgi:YHS domain-containing protein